MIEIEENKLYISGSLTFRDAKIITIFIRKVLLLDYKDIVLNLVDLDFIDSTGIGMLLVLQGQLKDSGKNFSIKGLKGQPLKVFTLSKLKSIFTTEL